MLKLKFSIRSFFGIRYSFEIKKTKKESFILLFINDL